MAKGDTPRGMKSVSLLVNAFVPIAASPNDIHNAIRIASRIAIRTRFQSDHPVKVIPVRTSYRRGDKPGGPAPRQRRPG